MTERIQRKRTKGWTLPPNTVCVSRPSRWGNPFFPGCGLGYGYFDKDMRMVNYSDRDPAQCVLMFRFRMKDMQRNQPHKYEQLIAPLVGANVACWCGLDEPCHGDVLLELAAAFPLTATKG